MRLIEKNQYTHTFTDSHFERGCPLLGLDPQTDVIVSVCVSVKGENLNHCSTDCVLRLPNRKQRNDMW